MRHMKLWMTVVLAFVPSVSSCSDPVFPKPAQSSPITQQEIFDVLAQAERDAKTTPPPNPAIELVTPPGWSKTDRRPLPVNDHGFTVGYEHDLIPIHTRPLLDSGRCPFISTQAGKFRLGTLVFEAPLREAQNVSDVQAFTTRPEFDQLDRAITLMVTGPAFSRFPAHSFPKRHAMTTCSNNRRHPHLGR